MSKNLSELAGRKGKGLTNNLFERIGQLAEETGTPSVEALDKLAKEFLVGTANTYGTTTFYDFLKPDNQGKKVYVCNGSTCELAGTQDKLKKDLCQHFKEDEIGHICCLGRCHENGAFQYDGKNYSAKSTEEIKAIVNGDSAQNKDSYNAVSHCKPILTYPFPGIETYYQPFKESLQKDSADVLLEIKNSGVRGRGGAGFPAGLKFDFCRNIVNETKFIICNADEGDPGAFSDRYLLEQRPHSVLFGMLIAGYVTHATHGVLYIRAEYPEAVEAVHQAIQELRDAKLIGQNILGTDFGFEFKVIKAQGAYICGEETALINSIEGQRPEVRTRPPFPAVQGLFNKPTVVNNVETLASLHFIITKGGMAYKSIGTEKSTGTKLLSLDSYFNKPGVYEVEMGTPLSVVINELGGGFKAPVKAMHIGGPLGGVVPISKINDLNISFESFSENGFMLGHGSIVCIPETYSMVKYVEHLFKFGADESCGKCFPCRLGTTRAYEMLQKAQNEDYKIDKVLFDDLLHTLETGSLCAHGGGLPLPVRNTLLYFAKEFNDVLM